METLAQEQAPNPISYWDILEVQRDDKELNELRNDPTISLNFRLKNMEL